MIRFNLHHPRDNTLEQQRDQRFEASKLATEFLYENRNLLGNQADGQATNQRYIESEDEESKISESILLQSTANKSPKKQLYADANSESPSDSDVSSSQLETSSYMANSNVKPS